MEIERKFLLSALPDIAPSKHIEIFQGYVSIDPEVRIRSYEVLEGEDAGHKDYKLTIKGNGSLSRKEIETYINEDFFYGVAAFIGLPLIHKDYRKYILGGHILECSIVDSGADTSFIYGEVEFPSEEAAKAYDWPFDGAVDVTLDDSFKMKNYWNRTRGCVEHED